MRRSEFTSLSRLWSNLSLTSPHRMKVVRVRKVRHSQYALKPYLEQFVCTELALIVHRQCDCRLCSRAALLEQQSFVGFHPLRSVAVHS